MQNKWRALFVAVLVAIPAPFVLGLLLQSYSPELFMFRSAGGGAGLGSDIAALMGSRAGILAYLSAFFLFVVTGFISAALVLSGASEARGGTAPAKRAGRKARPRDDEDGDFEEGTVKWFNVKKGFGFITRPDGSDVFVHFRAIEGQEGQGRRVLRQGERVRYTVFQADKGLQANQVEVIED